MKKVLVNILYIESWYWNRSLIILKWGSSRSGLKSFRETIDVSNIIRRGVPYSEVGGCGGGGTPDFKRQGWSNGGKYKNPKKSLGLQTKPPKNHGQKFNPPMSDVWCQMSDVRCPINVDVWCQISDVPCPMSDVLCRMSHIRRLMSDVRCLIYYVWSTMSDVRRPDVWFSMSDVWFSFADIRRPMSDFWCRMSDVFCLMSELFLGMVIYANEVETKVK